MWSGHDQVVYAVAFSPDARLALTGDMAGVMKIWGVKAGTEMAEIDGPPGSIDTASFSADGKQILFNKGKTAHLRPRP